jgi:4-amino-4-deoxy-L-arabinose transferase-like glycosyltransferase
MRKIRNLIEIYPWIIPTIIFSALVILGANMHPLWGDESETALFGRNILKYGLPKGWDGTNIMGINNAVVLDKNLLNHTSPWGQYYLVALSFGLFGESSFTARLPFILLSIVSLFLAYHLAFELTRNKRVSFLAVLILSLSVPFILFAYQARYYSLNLFAGLLFVTASILLDKKKFKIFFIISGIIFYYSNYVCFIAFYIATFIALLLYFKLKKSGFIKLKKLLYQYIVLGIIIAIFTAPWFLIMQPFATRGHIVIYSWKDILYGILVFLRLGLYPYNLNNAFPIVFLFIFIALLILEIRKKENFTVLIFPFSVAFFFIFIMAVFSLFAEVDTTFIHQRYTTLVFPFFRYYYCTPY